MRHFPSFFALRAFEAAARLGGFTLAGAELHLTPSAVSHQIRALERYFGRPLFARGGRRVTLTTDGERLLAALSGAFDAIEAACAELRAPPQAETLVVHCSPSFASKWLGPRLPSFLAAHPGIGIRLSSGADPFDLIRHEETDVLISYGPPLSHPELVSRPLGLEEVAALCTPAVEARYLDADGLRDRLPLLESSVSPVRWSEWFSLNGLTRPTARAGSAFDRGALVISAAVQGLGIALETVRFAQDELADGRLVRFGAGRFQSIGREMHLVTCRARQQSALKVRAFLDWLLREAGCPEAVGR